MRSSKALKHPDFRGFLPPVIQISKYCVEAQAHKHLGHMELPFAAALADDETTNVVLVCGPGHENTTAKQIFWPYSPTMRLLVHLVDTQ